jgi:fluoride exporter
VIVLAVGGAAAMGAVSRFLVDGAVRRRLVSRVPWGTLVVNVTGSLALGFLVGLAIYHGLGDGARAVLGAGFLGAYTTFSAHSYETLRWVEDGEHGAALRHNLMAVGLGLAAAATGLSLAAALP